MELYQLVATGRLANSLSGEARAAKIHSKRVFFTEAAARAEETEFVRKCTTPKGELDFWYLQKEDLSVDLVVLELVDEDPPIACFEASPSAKTRLEEAHRDAR